MTLTPAQIRKLMLDDLARSDLTANDATVLKMSLVEPKGFNRQPRYTLRYFEISGKPNCFYRERNLGTPPRDGRGKERRYTQPAGAAPRFYLPPLGIRWKAVAADPKQKIVFTEGEKKSACACKHGIPTIGLGGVFNFLRDGKPIADFEEFAWTGREVEICFDSDAANIFNVRLAEHRLAEELTRRGAVVKLVRLPSKPDGGKQGLDDYLLAHGAEKYRALPRQEPTPPERTTDAGNAQRLIKRHGVDLRYCPALGWLVWNGGHWEQDASGEIMRRAKDTARHIYAEASQEKDDTRRKNLAQWAAQSESASRLDAMVRLAQSEPGVHISVDELDADPWLLGVANGTIDLRTGELRAADREDYITQHTHIQYDSAAKCPLWDSFLRTITNGNQQLVDYLQQATGYSLTGDTSEQCMFVAHGSGANGKSTFIETIAAVLGCHAAATPVETIMARRGDRGIPNDVARLRGTRFVYTVETEEGHRLAESLVKQLTGGDTISARFLYKEHFQFRPIFKLWLAANHKPVVRGDDYAIWRRIRLIPFEVTIPENKQDKALVQKLRAELPGILRWIVTGCIAWQKAGLHTPEVVANATKKYREESDALRTWIEERCTLESKLECEASALYASYKNWAMDTNEPVLSQRYFAQRLEARGYKKIRREAGRIYVGISVKGRKF